MYDDYLVSRGKPANPALNNKLMLKEQQARSHYPRAQTDNPKKTPDFLVGDDMQHPEAVTQFNRYISNLQWMANPEYSPIDTSIAIRALDSAQRIKGNINKANALIDKVYMKQPAQLTPSEQQARDLKSQVDTAGSKILSTIFDSSPYADYGGMVEAMTQKDEAKKQYDALVNNDQYIQNNMARWKELAAKSVLTTDERLEAADAAKILKSAANKLRGGFWNMSTSIPSEDRLKANGYDALGAIFENKTRAGNAIAGGIFTSVPGATAWLDGLKSNPAVQNNAHYLGDNEIGQIALHNDPVQDVQTGNKGAFTVGQIIGNVAQFEVGASGLKALSAATRIKALANPAVINSVTMSANTAINGIANGDSWDTVVVNAVTSAISTATGTKIGNLAGSKVVSALNNLGLSERAVNALAASSNGVSFAVTQSALEETKNAFMYGEEYKPDAASIAANIITSILFGSLQAFKNNPKAAELQNRLKQGDVSAQKETADFLNKQSQTDNVLTSQEQAEQYINQRANAQGVESGDARGYYGDWDRIYEEAVKNAGEINISEPPKPASLSDVDARKWYIESEVKIPDLIDKTQTLEQQARQASALRNQFRTQARAAMSNRTGAARLDITDPNMSWEQIVKKYESQGLKGAALYEEIIRASTRSRTSINQILGIE